MLKHISKIALLLSIAVVSTFSSAGLITASAELNYEQEVSPSNLTPSDATGSATLMFNTDTSTLDIMASVVGIFLPDITFPDDAGLAFGAAGPFHIHSAPMGSNGPVVVPFNLAEYFTITESGFDVMATGISYDPNLINVLREGGLYLNLHTLDYRSGEIRGQLAVVSAPSIALMMLIACVFGFLRHRH